MEHFDLSDSPLKGTNLIEASAGTGKTYTITGLFLRLIIEKHLSVNEILVVTFTQAATEELKDRIRTRLREATDAFHGERCEDKILSALVKRHGDTENGCRRLEEAIRDFDKAAIFTIHGFCKRMLDENAFESGSLFDTELARDQEALKREIVEDFWRRHFYDASHLFVNYVLDNTSPDKLLSLLGNKLSQQNMKIIPRIEIPDSSEAESAFQASFNAVHQKWSSERTEIENILTTDNGLDGNKYRKTSIPKWILSMDEYLAMGDNNPGIFKKFRKFTSTGLENGTKKKCMPPSHPFFDLCEDLKNRQEALAGSFEKHLMGLKAELFEYVKNELEKRKETLNILSFDDLLLNLHTAIRKRGKSLVENIRTRFRAALIDEFQDTDPIQYDIFKMLFADDSSVSGANSENRENKSPVLFLIGDPKQAIYGFRGADIFAYMDAAKHAESRYTLGKNWRSEPKLISAVNTVFGNTDPAFLYEEIPFQPADSPSERKKPDAFKKFGFLTINKTPESPLQLWFANTNSKKPMNKSEAQERIPKAVAAEISQLLDKKNKVLLGEKPLREGDIAILLRQNREADLMRKILLSCNIPSVLHSTGNIFDSHESLETERVLSGITQPNSERRLRAALATDMMGLSGRELDALTENETAYEKWLVKFRQYHNLWNTEGFIRMFRQFISEEDILHRLMAFPDGERRNTNLLHLSEILHQAWIEKKTGMAWLVKWLSEQRNPNTPRLDEHQLRLESDENAVKLVTIHKSKGLQYPVVFCPFMYGGSEINDHTFLFHDENENRRLTLDLGSDDIEKNRMIAEHEKLAENLRLLYVALTRAKNRCYLVWGRFNKAETSALAYLLHHPGPSEDILRAMSENFKTLSDTDMFESLEAIRDRADGAICLSEMPQEVSPLYKKPSDKTEQLECQKFSGRIARNFRISSFSSLTSGRERRSELADHDAQTGQEDMTELEEPENAQKKAPDIFSFPKGARPGKCLHDIFEHLDFVEPSAMKELTADKLGKYDFDLKWQEPVCDMIRKVLSAPLDPECRELTLSQIRNEDRLNELEFYFPLNQISSKTLKTIFAKYAAAEFPNDFPEDIERLEFAPVRGFMKGFIDMVFQFRDKFYLVDWKSNFLGPRLADYHQNALLEPMKAHYYILQYHIYTVALHQYLFVRKPGYSYEKDFGGIFYIFLRGVDPNDGPDFGIYRDRPPEKLIRELYLKLIAARPEF